MSEDGDCVTEQPRPILTLHKNFSQAGPNTCYPEGELGWFNVSTGGQGGTFKQALLHLLFIILLSPPLGKLHSRRETWYLTGAKDASAGSSELFYNISLSQHHWCEERWPELGKENRSDDTFINFYLLSKCLYTLHSFTYEYILQKYLDIGVPYCTLWIPHWVGNLRSTWRKEQNTQFIKSQVMSGTKGRRKW